MLTVILLDVRRLEILRVLDVVESLAQGLEAVKVVCRLRYASCVYDVPCVHNGIGYLFLVVPTIVVAVWLRPRSLVCLWLAASRAMTTRNFLVFLIPLVLLLRLLLTIVASGSTARLRYDCCCCP